MPLRCRLNHAFVQVFCHAATQTPIIELRRSASPKYGKACYDRRRRAAGKAAGSVRKGEASPATRGRLERDGAGPAIRGVDQDRSVVRRPQVARCKSSPLRPRSTSPTAFGLEGRVRIPRIVGLCVHRFSPFRIRLATDSVMIITPVSASIYTSPESALADDGNHLFPEHSTRSAGPNGLRPVRFWAYKDYENGEEWINAMSAIPPVFGIARRWAMTTQIAAYVGAVVMLVGVIFHSNWLFAGPLLAMPSGYFFNLACYQCGWPACRQFGPSGKSQDSWRAPLISPLRFPARCTKCGAVFAEPVAD